MNSSVILSVEPDSKNVNKIASGKRGSGKKAERTHSWYMCGRSSPGELEEACRKQEAVMQEME